jgi:hypothetical protein
MGRSKGKMVDKNSGSKSLKKKTKGSAKTAANQQALKRTYSTRSSATGWADNVSASHKVDTNKKRSIKYTK